MSYWILPESGIPVSATTVQCMTYDEQSTNEMKTQIRHYDDKLHATFDAQSADMSHTLSRVDPYRIIDADNENEEFYEEITRIIDDATLPHGEDAQSWLASSLILMVLECNSLRPELVRAR